MYKLLPTALLFVCVTASLAAEEPSITALGTLGTTNLNSSARGVSADGSVVVGSTAFGDSFRAFRWKQSTGMEELGSLGPMGSSSAEDVSDDGSVVVGNASSDISGAWHAYRWTVAGMQDLGTIGGASGGSSAAGVSANGNVVVGNSAVPGGNSGFRWTAAGGMQSVGGLEGGESYVQDVSADGQSLVGYSSIPSDPAVARAFRWRPGSGSLDLGVAQGFPVSAAFGVSPDGEKVVGIASPSPPDQPRFRAALWTASAKMRTLDASVGHIAWDVSADGGVVVGQSALAAPGPFEGALVWVHGEKKTLHSLLTEAGVDLSQWSDFHDCSAISANGQVVVGSGHFIPDDCTMAFRAVLPNRMPSVGELAPVTVECKGDHNFVTLATTVADGDGPQVTVRWSVDGALRKTHVVPSGGTASFQFDYSDGEHEVTAEVSDGFLSVTAGTTVTVSDTTSPVVVVAPNVTLSVNKRKLYATRNRLKTPNVSDLCDEAPSVTNNAPARLPIGRNLVRWTAIDADGNMATATQRVKVVNAAPKANAGRDIRKSTSGESIRATLDGTKSSDRDRHRLTYAWTAPGVPIVNGTKAKAVGTFPLGTTVVKLTVSDAAGARSTDTVRVIVRRAGGKKSEAAIDAATADVGRTGARVVVQSAPDSAAVEGYRSAEAAHSFGRRASFAEDTLTRRALRYAQAQRSAAAGDSFVRAYLDAGNPDALSAAALSYRAAIEGLQNLEE